MRYRWYIIKRGSELRAYWDYIVMTLAIYNCVWTPLTISFDWAQLIDESPALKVIDITVIIFYTIDIIVQFLTSYINITTGDEITKPSYIARKYIKGEFTIDFLATFPFRYFKLANENHAFKLFSASSQLLKVLRIRKLYNVIAKSNQTVETKAMTKIAFFSFLLFIYTHIFGCVIWYFFQSEYFWVAPTDFGNIRSRM